MSNIATRIEGTPTVTLGEGAVFQLDLDVPLHNVFWETARRYDVHTENIATYSKNLAAALTRFSEIEYFTSHNPLGSSDVSSLNEAIAKRDAINTQLAQLKWLIRNS